MKTILYKLIIAGLLAGIIAACSSSGGGFAGIGGSGYVSTGSVTGFGSVFVNGVEFDTNSAIFEVEDNSASQADLRIGMVVQVEGTINSDGVTGTATGIRYGDQLEGPVSGMPVSADIDPNGDGTEKSFRVLGVNVIINAVDTIFEGTSFSFDNIALNNAVEISGYYDQNEVLRATYVERKAQVFDPASIVEIEGSISGLSGTSFSVRNVNVNAVSANLSDLPNGLQNGVYVEVKGTYSSGTNTINATEVEAEDIEFKDDGSEVSIEGYITRYVSASDFDINGYRINASAAVFEPAALELQLRAGIKVEAEGAIVNGILVASEVESAGGDAEIHATINGAPDIANGRITLRLAGADVTVSVNTSTTLEDDVLGIEPFSLANLNNGDFVEVVGYETGVSDVTATKVKRRSTDEFILQGFATAATGDATGGTVTILGVTYDFIGSTDFENENDVNLTSAQVDALIATINSTPTLLKVKDVTDDGTAEEIDLE